MYWDKYKEVLPVEAGNNREFIARCESELESILFSEIVEARPNADLWQLLDWLSAQLIRNQVDDICYVDLSGPQTEICVVHVLCCGLEVSAKKALFTPGPRAMELISQVEG